MCLVLMVFPNPTFHSSSYCPDFPPEHEPPELNLVEGQIANLRKQSHLTKLLSLRRQELVLGLQIFDSLCGNKTFFLQVLNDMSELLVRGHGFEPEHTYFRPATSSLKVEASYFGVIVL